MRERTVVTLAALSMALEEGTERPGALRRNVVTLPAVLVVAIDPPGEGGAYLGGALQLGSDPNEADIASTLCIASASSTTAASFRSPYFTICKCGESCGIAVSLCLTCFWHISIIVTGFVFVALRCSIIAASFIQPNTLGRRCLRSVASTDISIALLWYASRWWILLTWPNMRL